MVEIKKNISKLDGSIERVVKREDDREEMYIFYVLNLLHQISNNWQKRWVLTTEDLGDQQDMQESKRVHVSHCECPSHSGNSPLGDYCKATCLPKTGACKALPHLSFWQTPRDEKAQLHPSLCSELDPGWHQQVLARCFFIFPAALSWPGGIFSLNISFLLCPRRPGPEFYLYCHFPTVSHVSSLFSNKLGLLHKQTFTTALNEKIMFLWDP